MSYEKFTEEMKNYLNKAMDIYSTIKDKSIEKTIDNYSIKTVHIKDIHYFTKEDKKILSLFTASFLVEGDLKQILDEFDEIKTEDLLSFIDLKETEINTLEENEYSSFYEKYFKLELLKMTDESKIFYKINSITPEVIYILLGRPQINGNKILDYLSSMYDLGSRWISDHPSFETVKIFAKSKGYIKDKEFNRNSPMPFLSYHYKNNFFKENTQEPIVETSEKEENNEVKDFDDEKIWSILDEIQKKFIGQEEVCENIFYNIINNQELAKRNDVSDGERSIIFLDGPTGTGKTAITKEITDKLGIPFTSTSVTNYSSTGYVGGDITDVLKDLYEKSGNDKELAQKGIIVLDEFDKLAYKSESGLSMKKAVQQQLLDFMGGGKYKISTGYGFFGGMDIEFDTSKITFVCLGALSDLRSKKTEKKQPLGFGNYDNNNNVYNITPQDLIEIGLERELVGRFNTYLHTEEYSKANLYKILTESTISPLLGFRKWIESKNKNLEIEDGVLEAIVDAAYELNTGARSLQTVMNNIRTNYLKEVLRGKEEVVFLDLDTVKKTNEFAFSRKSRR